LIRIVHVSTYYDVGGAGRAACRNHQALLKANWDSHFIALSGRTGDPNVHILSDSEDVQHPWRNALIEKRFLDTVLGRSGDLRSLGLLRNGHVKKLITTLNPQVVNLHWINNGMMSIAQIGSLGYPIVWTLHDMWPLTGVDHYHSNSDDLNHAFGYHRPKNSNRLKSIVDRWLWKRKMRLYGDKDIKVVCPSRWMAAHAYVSPLFRNSNIFTIPNALDFNVFYPRDVKESRQRLNLPESKKLILFAAHGGVTDRRKAFDLLVEALFKLPRIQDGTIGCVILGSKGESIKLPDCIQAYCADVVQDDELLCQYYSAANVVVVPSRSDNLPQIGTEAQACGCPVVGFDVGGLRDIVCEGITGWLAKPFDTTDLAQKIDNTLRWSGEARISSFASAKRRWNEAVVADAYANVYRGSALDMPSSA
jgi:glycosyltransferase involved in cell wall biosynthesis